MIQVARKHIALWLTLGLTLWLLMLYGNALSNPFLIDDNDIIRTNPDVIEANGWRTLWSHHYWFGSDSEDASLYRPFTIFTYHINARFISPTNPLPHDAAWIFRIVNVLLLAAIGCVTASWLSRWVGVAWAWCATTLLVSHPANTELINHIVGRADLLAVLGIVGFLLVQQRAIMDGRWSIARIVAAIACTFIAVSSKEIGVLVVPAALAQAWTVKPANATAIRWTRASGVLIALVMVGLFLLMRTMVIGSHVQYVVGRNDITDNPLRALSLLERLPAACSIAWWHVSQTLWPDVSFNQQPPGVRTWSSLRAWLGVLTLVTTCGILIVAGIKRHWIAIALLLALSNYLIVGNLLMPIGTFAANRLLLPTLLAAAMILAVLPALLVSQNIRITPTRRVLAMVVCLLCVLAMGTRVVAANFDWRSHQTRMSADARKQSDNPAAWLLHGLAQIEAAGEAGSVDAAVNHYREAVHAFSTSVKLKPDTIEGRVQLAHAQTMVGNNLAAIEAAREVLARQPDHFESHLIIAAASLQRVAILQEQIITLSYTRDVTNLSQQQRLEQLQRQSNEQLKVASRHLRDVGKLTPGQPDVLFNQALLLVYEGRPNDAVKQLDALLAAHPDHVGAREARKQLVSQIGP